MKAVHINMVGVGVGFGFGRAFQILIFLSLFFPIKVISNHNNSSSLNALCIEIEQDALLKFKKELEDPSNRLSSWIPTTDCCKWRGIHCNTLTGHVEKLQLANTHVEWSGDEDMWISFGNSELKGNISDSILGLKHISHIDLSHNGFRGISIPSFLGSLASLNYLNLTESGFQGLIPHELGNLSKLQQLGLRGNSKSDELQLYTENLQWIQGLHSLVRLDLSYTDLSKVSDWLLDVNELPCLEELRLSHCDLNQISHVSHVNFTSLSILDISFNKFNTFIPKWILTLGSLVSLDLSYAGFQDPVPTGLSNLTSLKNLNIGYNRLNSFLPKSFLFSLTSLTSLDLSVNDFEGPIPCAIQNLSALTYLDLSRSHFNSTIPSCIYSLHKLEYLDLHSLNLQGEISSDIANLTNLVSLDLSGNELEGNIPWSIGSLSNLKYIYLSSNNISGHFTNQIAKLKNLQYLNLVDNFISGPIPESIGNLSSLIDLRLDRNKLNGTLPKSIGLLSSLKFISISKNSLEGIVSDVHFTNLVSLKELELSENNLLLSFPVGWIPPFNLLYIRLRSCNLGPQFPKWLESQKNFSYIDLSDAKILDNVPDWFWSLSTSYIYLNLSHNQLTGKIPDLLLNSPFAEIHLSSNKFYGNLPRISFHVSTLDLSYNAISGNMSRFLCHSTPKNNWLGILHLEDNLLSGNIPNCWEKWMSLYVVSLSNNNLYGKLPSSIGSLSTLQTLHLRNNSLFGKIPRALRNCSMLEILDMNQNAFEGNIPSWIGMNLSNLKVLGLRSNQLSDFIPDELCQLSSLQIMDIGNNNLIGSVPLCFGNFTAMATKRSFDDFPHYNLRNDPHEFFDNAYVVTKGKESKYDTILRLVTSIDLSDNNLSGEIPHEITNLFELYSLNLSGNNLNGNIPQQIGSMKNMESLDFSRNQLTGKIPQSISKLTFLSRLNLSDNNLSGQIPSSTQIQGLDPSSFIGNELCGLPLPNSCQREEKTSDKEDGEAKLKEGDENYIDQWFYLSVGIGFVVGFWGICGPLLISKSWRHKYFTFLSSICNKFN